MNRWTLSISTTAAVILFTLGMSFPAPAPAEGEKLDSKSAEVASEDDGADEAGVEAAKTHFGAILISDEETLEATYAPTVRLMPGHEFLKDKYGLTKPGGRVRGAEVGRDKLLETMAKNRGEKAGKEFLDRMMPSFKFEPLEVTKGDFVTDPTDPVETPDGKLHFSIKEGDVLVKISRPAVETSDFLLLHLREVDRKWQVVSEYFD